MSASLVWTATLRSSGGLLARMNPDEVYAAIRKAFQTGPAANDAVAVSIGAALAVAALYWMWRAYRARSGGGAAEKVDYLEAALRALGLSEPQRRSVRHVARMSGMPQPAAMLLCPQAMAAALDAAQQRGASPAALAETRALSELIFGAPPDPPVTRGASAG